ncbi:class F sortase [Brevibacillus massiliensis]|jgi:sortase (surface protein transpeptidase)|uniref:class F sortase n=1 Tax=Brevibacillus massiliensis TaxID=1118054 RepID=UPI00030A2897|nr:class F sortase [Brevibacillus massiliensis]
MLKHICLILVLALLVLPGCASAPTPSAVEQAPIEYQQSLPEAGSAAEPPDTAQPALTPPMEITQPAPTPPAQKPAPKRIGITPARLQIPSIKLNAPVEPVGVLKNGQMGVPKAFDRVGILMPWTKPGENGSAVIAGHLDHYTGPAVFYGLKKLKPQDKVIVSDKNGRKLNFVVKSVEFFPPAKAPRQRVFGESDTPRLNLITCAGKFNKKTQQHSLRLVVFTQLAEEQEQAGE